MRSLWIGYVDQLTQALVIRIQLEILDHLVQHRTAHDDRLIVLGQLGANLQIL